jgi:hypothetical protein
MTEEEWESETSSGWLIEKVRRSINLPPKVRGRKCRLAALAMLREFLAGATVPGLAAVMDAVERRCDDRGSLSEVDRAVTEAIRNFAPRSNVHPNWYSVIASLNSLDATVCLRGIASSTALAWEHMRAQHPPNPVAVQCRTIREVFGNPSRPVTFSPDWRTDTAIALARTMYEAREFSAMPILADALQDAGCDNTDILSHCRDANQVHVRGCWVVDLVLGKV